MPIVSSAGRFLTQGPRAQKQNQSSAGTTFRTCQWLCYHYSESLTLITYVEEAHDIDGNHGDDRVEEGHGDQALGDQLIILERNYQGDRCMEWHRRLTSSTRLHRKAQFVKIIKRSAMYLSSPSS